MKKFKIVVAGCGNMSNVWIQYALSRKDPPKAGQPRAGIEIVALVDIKKENAKSIIEKYNLSCSFYKDISEAIEKTNANLVFDITIPKAHKTIVTTSLKLGCDVFGEKPMASSLKEAREMVATTKKYGRTYAVMQNSRYSKNIRALRKLIESDTIGKPGFICADFFKGVHFGGFRDIMDSPLILDMAIHTFDQARFLSGADPVSVYCKEFNIKGSWYKGAASAVCIFEFSNGSIFCYRGSWSSEGCPTTWGASWRIAGSKGTAIWDGENVPYAEIVVPSDEKKNINDYKRVDATYEWKGRKGHDGCLDEMFSAIIEGRKPETDCNDNIKSIAMVFGALESSKKGHKIEIKS